MNTSTHPSHSAQAFHIAFSGFLALVVAMVLLLRLKYR